MEKTGLQFEQVIDLLLFLFLWVLPFYTATRELLDHDNAQEMAYYEALKLHKLTSSFDLLEGGHTPSGRKDLVKMTGLPELGQFQVCHPSERAGRWRPGITICG